MCGLGICTFPTLRRDQALPSSRFKPVPVPHTFPNVLNPASQAAVLLIGAGMSNQIAPSVDDVVKHVRTTHAQIVADVGFDPSPPPTGFGDFYDWAERLFDGLRTHSGLNAATAKIRLAELIGVTTNPAYQEKVEAVALRKFWARHRVAARLAREGRWKSIWSLNWDCVLESALDCIGLRPHPQPGTSPASSVPWNQWYIVWSPGDLTAPAGHNGTIYVCKPHGCVRKIVAGNPLFIVTRSELQALTPQLQPAVEELNVGLAHAPLVAAGWRADEDYICRNIEGLRNKAMLLGAGPDRLSVINRTWYPSPAVTPPTHHDRLAATFGVTRDNCFFEVSKSGMPSIDELFQWTQTRYFLRLLINFAAHGPWAAVVPQLSAVEDFFAEPRPIEVINFFVDDFLSVWNRLCFNTGGVVYIRNSAPIPQPLVATDLRDEHIPWMYDQAVRHDLLATIPLLLRMWGQRNVAGAVQWDFGEFPGALWDGLNGHLVLPLPAWGDTGKPIDLAGLKPLIEGRSWERKGEIRKLSVLPLHSDPAAAAFDDAKFAMRSSIASLMPSAAFASASSLAVASLADI